MITDVLLTSTGMQDGESWQQKTNKAWRDNKDLENGNRKVKTQMHQVKITVIVGIVIPRLYKKRVTTSHMQNHYNKADYKEK